MPPKGRPRRRIPNNGVDNSREEVYDVISLRDTSDNPSVVMTGRRAAPRKARAVATAHPIRGGRSTRSSRPVVPDVFQDLLAETLNSPDAEISERPPKRRRTKRTEDGASTDGSVKTLAQSIVHEDDDASISFEDVLPQNTQQTAYRDSDEELEDSDYAWETFDIAPRVPQTIDDAVGSGDLDITLDNINKQSTPLRKSVPARRKVTSADRTLHLEIHKMHILCLLSHNSRRNSWCNDPETQSALKSLISKKTLGNLRPPTNSNLSQFRQTDLLKEGLEQLGQLWITRFEITSRGMRRPLWVDDEKRLKDFKLSPDSEPPLDLSDFRKAAKTLKGSRDLGAQLYCALLRSAGLEARLVCSLQPLSYTATAKTIAPPMSTTSPTIRRTPSPGISEDEEAINLQDKNPFGQDGPSSHAPFSARRRLGHPNAADYHLPNIVSPIKPSIPKPKRKRIYESPYPVYWVEVLDEAHQKWMPVDPLVTGTIAKPRLFEPPGTDHENVMSYVIAFEDDGVARDVTKRYTKAYNSKTRKIRVETTEGGDRWWKKVFRRYKRDWQRDLDQIEDSELAALEAKEPMPKSIADFKDHPNYALERHLRKNEVLINRHEVGKVAGGRDASVSGGKKMESVYRRSAVQVARSADRWYRMGRDVKMGEQPVKTVAARSKEDDEGDQAGVGLYTESQTEIYEAPPVVNGRVPRNAYGNLDVYVPSMVPRGGVHISFDEASRAARILGIDYADAITGFKFEGRHGRPVINGIVVAEEYKDATEAVIEGFRDERARAEEEMRSLSALRMWKKFLVGLRIKERVDAYEIEGEDMHDQALENKAVDDDDGMESEEYDDDGGGGFFPE